MPRAWVAAPAAVGLAVHMKSRADLGKPTSLRIESVEQTAFVQLGVSSDFINSVDRSGWNPRLAEQRKPMVSAICAKQSLDQIDNFGTLLSSLAVRVIAGLAADLRLTHGAPEPLPDRVVAQPQRKRNIRRFKRLVNCDDTILAARSARQFPRS